jgi:hypothetical protein
LDRTTRAWIFCILVTSFVLNLWGINFGLPDAWHPDEIVYKAVAMAQDFSLNPHEFKYGSLHFYQILLTMAPTYFVTELLSLDPKAQKTAVFVAARALSAALGTGCVALVFFVGRQLFGPTAGILSAAFLTLTMGFVNISHYATVDIPMLFGMLASFLTATHVLRAGGTKSYVLAGMFAGLAAATKYPGGAIILSLLAAHFLRQGRRNHAALVYGIAASAISFVVANPPMLLSSCEFFEGFVKNAAFHAAEGVTADGVALSIIGDIYHATGPALGILAALSLAYALALICGKKQPRETLLLCSMLLPCFFVVLSKNFSIMRYVIPMLPPLVLLTAKMIDDMLSARNVFFRYLGVTVTSLTIVISGAYTVAADLEITNDSRKLAAAWIDRNATEGATIETTLSGVSLDGHRGGRLSKDFKIVLRPKIYSDRLREWVERIEGMSIYRALYPRFLAYASFAEAAGLCNGQRPYFEGWYEEQLMSQEHALANFDQTIDGLEQRAPDYVVVSSLWLQVDGATPEGRFFTDLLSGKSAYRQVAKIHYSALPFSWLDPEPEFVNPTIRIFERANGPQIPLEESG